MLEMVGDNAFSLWQGERPVASALALDYGRRFAWICMVLVTADWRGRGIATQLLRALISRLATQGLIAGLDATEAGRVVYRPLGFNDIYAISRMVATPGRVVGSWRSIAPEGIVIRPLSIDELDVLVAWDGPVFGAERYGVLAALRQRLPDCAFIARTAAGEIAGYVLGRDGSTATQLGPIMAVNEAVAKTLLVAALAIPKKSATVLIDALDQHQSWLAFLHDLGFVWQRGFSRMLRNYHRPLDAAAKIFAVAGPELG